MNRKKITRHAATWFLLGGLLMIPARDTLNGAEILVVADVMPAGKSAPPVSPASPVYYEAVWAGFRELGAVAAGERVPSAGPIKAQLTGALRKLGYLEAGPGTPPPTQLLFFAWGTLNPDVVTTPGTGSSGGDETTSYNSAQMIAFLGAHKIARQAAQSEDSQRLASTSAQDQYFLAVAAYDRASMLERKRKLLWMTRIATESDRVWLPETLPAMVAAGGEMFGQDSDRPVWIDPADKRKAEVIIGTPRVEEFEPPEDAPPPGKP